MLVVFAAVVYVQQVHEPDDLKGEASINLTHSCRDSELYPQHSYMDTSHT